MRYFGYTLQQAEEMTLREYSYMIHVHQLKHIDHERDIYLQAYLNEVAKAKKKQGKNHSPMFQTFKQFYDYEKQIEELTKPKLKVLSKRDRLIMKANSL